MNKRIIILVHWCNVCLPASLQLKGKVGPRNGPADDNKYQ